MTEYIELPADWREQFRGNTSVTITALVESWRSVSSPDGEETPTPIRVFRYLRTGYAGPTGPVYRVYPDGRVTISGRGDNPETAAEEVTVVSLEQFRDEGSMVESSEPAPASPILGVRAPDVEISDEVIVYFEGRPVVGMPLPVKVGWEGDQFVELPASFARPASPSLGGGDSEVPELADLQGEVRRLVHAVDRVLHGWNEPDSKWTNDELWRHLHACNAAVWGRLDPAGSVGGGDSTETPAPLNAVDLGWALQRAWDEWVADTGHIPDGFQIHGPVTSRLSANFQGATFVHHAADWYARAERKLRPAGSVGTTDSTEDGPEPPRLVETRTRRVPSMETRTGTDWCPGCLVEVGTSRYTQESCALERCAVCGAILVPIPVFGGGQAEDYPHA